MANNIIVVVTTVLAFLTVYIVASRMTDQAERERAQAERQAMDQLSEANPSPPGKFEDDRFELRACSGFASKISVSLVPRSGPERPLKANDTVVGTFEGIDPTVPPGPRKQMKSDQLNIVNGADPPANTPYYCHYVVGLFKADSLVPVVRYDTDLDDFSQKTAFLGDVDTATGPVDLTLRVIPSGQACLWHFDNPKPEVVQLGFAATCKSILDLPLHVVPTG